MESIPTEPSTTLFFAYGSHMLTVRNELDNIRAEFVSIARLDVCYFAICIFLQICFIYLQINLHLFKKIIYRITDWISSGIQSFGAGRKLQWCPQQMLRNKQVHLKRYYIIHTEVNTPHMGKLVCRVYIQKINPLPRGDNDDIPVEQWPSRTYKKVMILGAIEHNLPYYYIRNLKKLKHNGELGCYRMAKLLKLFTTRYPCTCRLYDPRRPRILDMKKLREKMKVK
ncbi:hypothetical protein RR48_06160 [Papilio machaon]|uniref:Gamma-glutamylcyclotransferase n=1 Tax=Papilio machaon TaxID=76193 RepID=A0A194QT77_PAPMA|nr:hypothetical protein RR48_06160 [Papilio machaon]